MVDKIEKKDARMVYYLTDQIVASYSTKPMQGSLFIYYGNLILRIDDNEFKIYKRWYKEVLKRYNLWDENEVDLEII